MMPDTIQDHVREAQEALRSFLLTIIDNATPLEVDEAEETTFDQATDAVASQLVVHDPSVGFAVVLEEGWVELISQAMLGEAMAADDPGAEDLVSEIAAQGYGAVRSALAGEGLRLPESAMQVSLPGDGGLALDGPVWRVAFRMDVESMPEQLGGFALFPSPDTSVDEPATAETVEPEAPSASKPKAAAGPPADNPAPSHPSPGGGSKGSGSDTPVEVAAASFSELGEENLRGAGGDGASGNFDLLAEVELEVTVELGRRRLPLADVLRLTPGSVIELEKLVGEPLEIYANGRLIAEGEAVVIDEQFGVRITSLASSNQREKAFF